MTTITKTCALESLLNEALSLVDAANIFTKELEEMSKPTGDDGVRLDAEAVSAWRANLSTFSRKREALWDRCETVGRGEYETTLST